MKSILLLFLTVTLLVTFSCSSNPSIKKQHNNAGAKASYEPVQNEDTEETTIVDEDPVEVPDYSDTDNQQTEEQEEKTNNEDNYYPETQYNDDEDY